MLIEYIIRIQRNLQKIPILNPMSTIQQLQKRISYPVLNIYCCPRFYKGLIIADGRAPLTKYLPEVSAPNCTKIIQDQTPDKNQISNFRIEDGMIYNYGRMSKKIKKQYDFKGLKMLVCICMYNESKYALETSLKGIYSSLPHLKQAGITQHDIAVVIVQDGILKLIKSQVTRQYQKDNNSVISFYRQLDKRQGKNKCYLQERLNIILDEVDNFQRKRMRDLVRNNHDFPPSIDKNLSMLYQNLWSPNPQDPVKLKLLSCFKHKNGMKLSSHLWFFQGFCRQFNPEVCVLLDVGTMPSPISMIKYMQAFEDKNVGGVTGFMSVDANFQSQEGDEQQKPNCFVNAFFSIQKAQQFQYIIAHFIDKNLQSALGFLHVLPGAWSAYRYEALIHGQKYQQNLLQKKYFKMILDPSLEQRDYRQANMYLAQDRILSLGIYCQHDRKFYLKYVPDAVAFTDPMKSHEQLMIQRRRWINSSLFAFMYVFRNFYYHSLDSKHNFMRKYIALIFNMILALISFVNGYFIPAFYTFALYTTIVQSGSNYIIDYSAELITFLYIFMNILSVTWSLLGTQWTKKAHIVSYIFSFYTFLLLTLMMWNIVVIYMDINSISSFLEAINHPESALVFIITSINIFGYIIMALIHVPTHCNFVCKLGIDSMSYLAFQGAYSHIMVSYAFCNVDNVSWGTKGNKGTNVKGYLSDKVTFVSKWLLYNSILAFFFIYIDFFMPRQTQKGLMLMVIGIYATLIFFIKIVLAVFYQIKWMLFERCCNKLTLDPERQNKIIQFWLQQYKEFLDATADKSVKK